MNCAIVIRHECKILHLSCRRGIAGTLPVWQMQPFDLDAIVFPTTISAGDTYSQDGAITATVPHSYSFGIARSVKLKMIRSYQVSRLSSATSLLTSITTIVAHKAQMVL